MPRTLLCLLTAALLSAGCASSGNTPPRAQTSLPDGRSLSEHPLDVLAIPQP